MDLDTARALVLERAHHICEGCGMRAGALDAHHRQARGAGGVHGEAADASNHPSNLLALCRAECHPATEDADSWEECLARGWRVRHTHIHDARDVPALLWTVNGRGWWLLSPDAGYIRVDWPADYRLDATDLLGESWRAAVDPAVLDLLPTRR